MSDVIVQRNVIMINDQMRSFALMDNKIVIQYHNGYTSNEHYSDHKSASKFYDLMMKSANHAGLYYVHIGP